MRGGGIVNAALLDRLEELDPAWYTEEQVLGLLELPPGCAEAY